MLAKNDKMKVSSNQSCPLYNDKDGSIESVLSISLRYLQETFHIMRLEQICWDALN